MDYQENLKPKLHDTRQIMVAGILFFEETCSRKIGKRIHDPMVSKGKILKY